jgi:CubicO group peptidase (beta-lactamase class C family)
MEAITAHARIRFPAALGGCLLCAGIVTAATAHAAAAAGSARIPTQDAAAAQASATSTRILEKLVESSGVPGMGAAVWREGRLVWSGSAGRRDVAAGAPVDADTVFRLASVSKVIAATAAAKLAEQGRMDLDAPVADMVAGLRADWPAITPRQLAAHVSGLPHYQAQDESRGDRHHADVRSAVRLFERRELLSPPGQRYLYSSWGYTLLSAAIEARAERPFLDYLAREITPGLRIGADATHGGDAHASRPYEFVDGRARLAAPHDYSYAWAGGGLSATPGALARFGGRVLDGGIVSRAGFDAMVKPALLADGSEVRDEDYRVGLGWRSGEDVHGRRIVHHAGTNVGGRSALVLWPDQQVAASLLSNASWVSSIVQTAMTLAAPFEPAASTPAKAACPLSATRYRGQFGTMAMQGEARFTRVDGRCEGRLQLQGEAKAYFDAFLQKDADALHVVGIDGDGGLARAALIANSGAYDLLAGSDGQHRARFSESRSFVLAFE